MKKGDKVRVVGPDNTGDLEWMPEEKYVAFEQGSIGTIEEVYEETLECEVYFESAPLNVEFHFDSLEIIEADK